MDSKGLDQATGDNWGGTKGQKAEEKTGVSGVKWAGRRVLDGHGREVMKLQERS